MLGVASSFLAARAAPQAATTGVSGRGSTAARRSACSACSARSSRVERARARLRPLAVPDAADLAHGLLGPLVRAADGTWDLGVVRTPGGARGRARRRGRGRRLARAARGAPWVLVAACVAVIVLIAVPATLLQVGLRDGLGAVVPRRTTRRTRSSSPATLVRHGHTPYGHDYEGSGLERFYSRDGTVPPPAEHPQVALTALRVLPRARR